MNADDKNKMEEALLLKRPKLIIHKLNSEGGENPYESEWVTCDPNDRYQSATANYKWEKVTCLKCLKRKPL